MAQFFGYNGSTYLLALHSRNASRSILKSQKASYMTFLKFLNDGADL
jgi:hypothetical protein